jgi:hypothetical protein
VVEDFDYFGEKGPVSRFPREPLGTRVPAASIANALLPQARLKRAFGGPVY